MRKTDSSGSITTASQPEPVVANHTNRKKKTIPYHTHAKHAEFFF
jgi:hypothetical protein